MSHDEAPAPTSESARFGHVRSVLEAPHDASRWIALVRALNDLNQHPGAMDRYGAHLHTHPKLPPRRVPPARWLDEAVRTGRFDRLRCADTLALGRRMQGPPEAAMASLRAWDTLRRVTTHATHDAQVSLIVSHPGVQEAQCYGATPEQAGRIWSHALTGALHTLDLDLEDALALRQEVWNPTALTALSLRFRPPRQPISFGGDADEVMTHLTPLLTRGAPQLRTLKLILRSVALSPRHARLLRDVPLTSLTFEGLSFPTSATLPHLRELSLRRAPLDDPEAGHTARDDRRPVFGAPDLHTLRVGEGAGRLLQRIAHDERVAPHLTTLETAGIEGELFEALVSSTPLHALDCRLSDEVSRRHTTPRHVSTLRTLHLFSSPDQLPHALATAQWPALHTLSWGDGAHPLDDEAAALDTARWPDLPALRELTLRAGHLSRCQLRPGALARHLTPQVHTLNLARLALDRRDLDTICRWMRTATPRVLQLERAGLSPEDRARVLDTARAQHLEHLSISGPIGALSGAHLAPRSFMIFAEEDLSPDSLRTTLDGFRPGALELLYLAHPGSGDVAPALLDVIQHHPATRRLVALLLRRGLWTRESIEPWQNDALTTVSGASPGGDWTGSWTDWLGGM